jgi:hypothetical protein
MFESQPNPLVGSEIFLEINPLLLAGIKLEKRLSKLQGVI